MQVSTVKQEIDSLSSHALVLPLADDGGLPPDLQRLDSRLDGLLGRLRESAQLRGKADTQEVVHTLGRLKAARLVIMGIGKASDLDLKRLTDWAVRTGKRLRRAGVTEAHLRLPQVTGATQAAVARAAVEGLTLTAHDFRGQRTGNDQRPELERVTLVAGDDAELAALSEGARLGAAVAAGMSLARELGNEPANIATPSFIADRAATMARERGLGCEVLDRDQMAALGMGSLLGVAQGSDEPPRFIILEKKAPAGSPTIALIGKGITFDSGGISIKPAARMHEMKYDMMGGGAVIGAMRALAELTTRSRVVGIIPCCENLPSGRSMKPGDVLKSMSGLTIEVTNTDAEGRLILADAITYAKRYEPAAIIDIATLTGAIVTTLGAHAMGLFGNDESFVEYVRAAGLRTGERSWPFPLWNEYMEDIKSPCADMVNSATAGGKSITAAALLSRFAEGVKWAHLDIAGTAWGEGTSDSAVAGATGSGVRTLVESVLAWS